MKWNDNEISIEGSDYCCLSVILIYSVIQTGKNY